MKRFTYCYRFYGSLSIEAATKEEADRMFDEIDIEELQENEDDWELTLIQEEDENGKLKEYLL